MSKSVRASLILLRAYLIFIGLIFAYHMLDLVGLFGHQGAR